MATRSAERIPSLDGLRAISITLVLIGHLAGTRGFPLSAATGNFWALGELGVHVFFVISGFLITGLLLDELARTSRIRLGRFYFRRTLRIFPPYYTLLFALVAAQAAGWIALRPGDTWHALTYTSNYDAARSWSIGHTWSLAVEEQFYLLWPATVVLLGVRRGMLAAALVVVLTPIIRVAELHMLPSMVDGIGHRFETVADAIAIGCVLAGARERLHQSRHYMAALSSPLFIVVPLVGLAGNLTGDHAHVSFLMGRSLANLGTVLCLDWCVTFPDGRVGRILNAAPLVFVGWMSYSLYLWQQPFLNRASDAIVNTFPLNITLACAGALASYYLVERPSLQLRRWIESWHMRRAPLPVGADPRPDVVVP